MSERIVVDTCVFSYAFNNHSLSRLYEPHLFGKRLLLSFQSVEELIAGAYRKKWGPIRFQCIMNEIETKYTILYPDDNTIRRCAIINAVRKHRPISMADAWIAACALAESCPLLTLNGKDFADIPGLRVITVAP